MFARDELVNVIWGAGWGDGSTINRAFSISGLMTIFFSAMRKLRMGQGISLTVEKNTNDVEGLCVLFAHPNAKWIRKLKWTHSGVGNAFNVIPFLVKGSPYLRSIDVRLPDETVFNFLADVLAQSNMIEELYIPMEMSEENDHYTFFDLLGKSQVTTFTIYGGDIGLDFISCWKKFLTVGLLQNLTLEEATSLELVHTLTKCESLKTLTFERCDTWRTKYGDYGECDDCDSDDEDVTIEEYFAAGLPPGLETLVFKRCTFYEGFDWSFLETSMVKNLSFRSVHGVDGAALGNCLAYRLRALTMDRLRIWTSDFGDAFLFSVGVELGQIVHLDLGTYEHSTPLNESSVLQIALALQTADCVMHELTMYYERDLDPSIKAYLVPVLKSPRCGLARLTLYMHVGTRENRVVEREFRKRLALFALLEGQQVRRWYCPLRRLPVEMLRLTGMMLM